MGNVTQYISWRMVPLVLWMVGGSGLVQAQEAELTVQVAFIAGQNMYLSAGSEAGLAVDDTLVAFRDARRLGLLQVLGITRSRAVTTFAGPAFAVTRGDTLTLVVASARSLPPPITTPEAAADTVRRPARVSVFTRGSTLVRLPPVEEGIRVTGRLMLGLDLLTSKTQGQRSSFERTRVYQIPSATLKATVEDLPLALRFNVNGRVAYRSNESRLGINPTRSVRIYQLNLERALPDAPVQVRAGRFFNPAETFSGFWDGVGLAYAPRGGFGAGVLAGVQPRRADEQFSTDLPKYTLFGQYRHRNPTGGTRYEAGASFHQVRPNNGLRTHTFLGVAQTFWWQRVRLRQLLQLDRDPERDAWTITRFQVQGVLPAGRRVTVRGRYLLRRPYQILRTSQMVGYERTRLSAGFSVRAYQGVLSMDLATNASDRTTRSYTSTAYLTFPNIRMLGVGVSALLNYWSRADGATVLYLAPGVSRTLGRVASRLEYQFQRSTFDPITATRHAVELSLNVPLARRIRAGLLLRTQRGAYATSNRAYASLWIPL